MFSFYFACRGCALEDCHHLNSKASSFLLHKKKDLILKMYADFALKEEI